MSRKKLPAMPIFVDRWLNGTRYLGENARENLMLKGAYLDLLLYLFDQRKPIKDAEHVGRILGVDKRLAKNLWNKLCHKFLTSPHGSTHGLVTELLKNGGRIKGLQAEDRPQNPHVVPDPDPDLTSSLPSQESRSGDPLEGRSVKSYPRKNANTTTAGYPFDFERLWEARARRAGGDDKRRAARAWNARLKEGHTAETIQAGMERYRAFCRAQDKEGTQYVMQTATFLGPSDPPHFVESWDIPLATGAKTKLSATEQLRAAGWFDDGVTIEGEYHEKH